jgi:FlaA1/EpsC-like NDP-sugar epimerase
LGRFYWFATLSTLWLVVGSAFRIYDLAKAYNVPDSLKSTLSTAAIVSFLNLLIPVLTPAPPLRRSEAAGFLLLMLIGPGFWRLVFARLFVHPGFHRRALIVGAGWAGHTLVEAMSHFASSGGNPYVGKGYELLGFIDDDTMKKWFVRARHK